MSKYNSNQPRVRGKFKMQGIFNRNVLFIGLILLLTLSILLTVSFSITYYRILLSKNQPTGFFLLDVAFIFPNYENLSVDDQKNFLSFVVNLLVFINTFVTIAITLISQKRKEISLEKDAGIEKILIKYRKDDVKIMNKEFLEASKVTIFSGDFDWIIADEIKYTMKGLAEKGRLDLFTDNKNKDAIKLALGQEYDFFKNHIRLSDIPKLRCSLVEKDGNYKFLYSQTIIERGEEKTYVFIVRHYKEGQYLLELLSKFIYSLRPMEEQRDGD